MADGGLLNNLPVDVVKAMGADIVIAVHLDSGKVQPKEVRSLLDVAGRSIDVVIEANELNNMLAADVLLTADVATYDTLDFQQAEKIVPKGYEAAKAKAAMLQKLSVSDADWGKYRAAVEARRLKPDVSPRFIEVEGASPAETREIQPSLAGFLGKPLDPAKFERSLTHLTGDGRIDTVGYSIKQRGNEEGLLVTVTPKEHAPPAFYPAFEVDGADLKDVRFTLGGRLSMLDVGGYRSEVRVDASVGGVYKLGAEYYHPFSPESRWFLAPHGYVSNTSFNVFSRADLIADLPRKPRRGRPGRGLWVRALQRGAAGARRGLLQRGPSGGRPNARHAAVAERAQPPCSTVWTTLTTLSSRARARPSGPRSNRVDANPGATNGYPVAETQIQLFRQISKPASVFLFRQRRDDL